MKNKLLIIAEIAQGFEGNFEQSKLLIKAAAKAGADAVKFQLVYANELATADYKYYSLFKELEMSLSQWKSLKDYALSLNTNLIVDVFGEKSLKTAENLNINMIKVHGTDVTNIGLLEKIAISSLNTVILGVGGAYWEEIENAIKILKNKHLILLCGFQGYPTKIEDNHINRMKFISKKTKGMHTNYQMGFADHPGDEKYNSTLCLIALGAGADVIEKHLTLGKVMEMEDFESALNPDEFKFFIEQIKSGKLALGNISSLNDFGMSRAEKKYRKNIRRDVVAKKEIIKGEILNEHKVTLKRTSNIGSIKEVKLVLGKQAKRLIKKDHPILTKDIN